MATEPSKDAHVICPQGNANYSSNETHCTPTEMAKIQNEEKTRTWRSRDALPVGTQMTQPLGKAVSYGAKDALTTRSRHRAPR